MFIAAFSATAAFVSFCANAFRCIASLAKTPRMKIRFLVCSLVLVALVLVAGCSKKSATASGAAGDAGDKIQIGFLVKQPEEPWFQQEWKGARKAAKQYGFVLREVPVQDSAKVVSAIDNLGAVGAKGFVICTPDVRLGPTIVRRAQDNGLKVVAVDDQFVDADGTFMKDVPYLGMSATDIGQAVGTTLAAEMKKRGWNPDETGACIITREELDTARQRTDGAIEALKKAGFSAERIFKAPQKTTDSPGALDAANILLTQQPGVKRWLIAGMNDNAVLGAVRAMEARGFGADNVIGIGINGTDCIDEFRRASPTGFFGSMLVSAPQEGFRTAEMVYLWVKEGKKPPLDTRTEGIFITRDNFEEVLRREGIID
jgi:L-arabinose transport system substrate-binding protein